MWCRPAIRCGGTDLVFSCNATQGWQLIQGKYDASAGCSSSPGSSPYVFYGNR